MNWSRLVIAMALLAHAPASANAGTTYLVTERFTGRIQRLEDVNGDGDALDAGERVLWSMGLSNAGELARYQSGVLVVDSVAARILYFEDLNHDGDALDANESVLWADGFSNPYGIDVGTDGSAYLSDFATHKIFRARDLNHDGDALDANEKVLYAENLPGALSILAAGDQQLVDAFNTGQVHALSDINGDGDALDAGENLTYTPNSITSVEGIATREGGGYYVGSSFYDAIYSVVDKNGDGDAFDVGEVVSYADNFFGGLNDPWGMAAGAGGSLLVANLSAGNVLAIFDKNHDGDALDRGEIVVFADGINAPVDIVSIPFGLPGDYNNDGLVNALDYTVWRNNFGDANEADIHNNGDGGGVGESDFNLWKQHYGDPGSGGGGIAAESSQIVPEPATIALFATALLFLGRRSCSGRFPAFFG